MKTDSPKFSNVQSLLIGFAVLVIAMAVSYYYFFYGLQKTGEKISTLSNQTDSLLAEESNLNSLKTIFSATTNEREKINSFFIKNDGTVDFLATIENLATFAHLSNETESVEVEEENPASPAREELHINFRTTGTWQNTYYFISMLETLPYNIVINSISLRGTGEKGTEETSGPSLDLSSSSSNKIIQTQGSIWEGSYDFSVKKMK